MNKICHNQITFYDIYNFRNLFERDLHSLGRI